MTDRTDPGAAAARIIARRSAARRRAHRRVRIVGAVALLAGGLYFLACLFLFVLPAGDPVPASVDAVFVPAPVTASKEAVALRALREHRTRAVLLSVPEQVRIPGTRENLHFRFCRPERGVYCEVAADDGARSNLRLLSRLGGREGWQEVLVVSDRTALIEMRRAAGRCPSIEASVTTVADPPPGGWIPAFVGETFRLLGDRSPTCR